VAENPELKTWRLSAHEKRNIFIELAKGVSSTILGPKYGVAPSSVRSLAMDHRAEIAAYREQITAGIEDQVIGLWVADKANRVTQLQQVIEQVNDALPGGVTNDDTVLLKVKMSALRQAAEELGQLVHRVDAGGKVSYTIDGVDMEGLT